MLPPGALGPAELRAQEARRSRLPGDPRKNPGAQAGLDAAQLDRRASTFFRTSRLKPSAKNSSATRKIWKRLSVSAGLLPSIAWPANCRIHPPTKNAPHQIQPETRPVAAASAAA